MLQHIEQPIESEGSGVVVAFETSEDVIVGDLVRTGPNLYPHYTVIAIHADKAWVRDVNTGMDGLTDLALCRKITQPQSPLGLVQ